MASIHAFLSSMKVGQAQHNLADLYTLLLSPSLSRSWLAGTSGVSSASGRSADVIFPRSSCPHSSGFARCSSRGRFQPVSIYIEQDRSEVLGELEPERWIADIGGNVTDEQVAHRVNHLCDEALLRNGVDALTLLPAKGGINHRPHMVVRSRSQISDMVIMGVQPTTSRLNMQVVMTGWVAGVIFPHA